MTEWAWRLLEVDGFGRRQWAVAVNYTCCASSRCLSRLEDTNLPHGCGEVAELERPLSEQPGASVMTALADSHRVYGQSVHKFGSHATIFHAWSIHKVPRCVVTYKQRRELDPPSQVSHRRE